MNIMQSEEINIHPPNHPQPEDYDEDFEPLQDSISQIKNTSELRQSVAKEKQEEQNQLDGKNQQGYLKNQGQQDHRDDSGGGQDQKLETKQNDEQLPQMHLGNKNNSNKAEEQNSEANQEKTRKKEEDKESRIKDTIDRITKNILFSKQSIVEDITSINNYYQENEKELHQQLREGAKSKVVGLYVPSYSNGNHGSKLPIKHQRGKLQAQEKVQKAMKLHIGEKLRAEQKAKEMEKKRNRQIYEQQKQARRQQQMAEKQQSSVKKNQLQRRIIYEQKFISRRSGSPEIPISAEEIKAFQDAFIQQIKDRLNIGKSKNRTKSLQEQQQLRRIKVEEQKKNYNKKIHKGYKLKQKIILNLKQQIQKQLEPTYSSVLADSNQMEQPGTPERKRTHQSAPQFKLPPVSPSKPLRRTFYSKQKTPQRVHVLKLSKDPHQE